MKKRRQMTKTEVGDGGDTEGGDEGDAEGGKNDSV